MTKILSQRTLVAVMRTLRDYGTVADDLAEPPDFIELFYENGFPAWFAIHARSQYSYDWREILPAIRNTQFFFPHTYFGAPGANITDKPYLDEREAAEIGEWLLQRLASLASTLHEGGPVVRSLELDGFRVDEKNLRLVALDSVTSEREEEERVVSLVNRSGLACSAVILKHLEDARDHFLQQKDHSSIGEARNFVQALLDGIGDETHGHGAHSVGYPGGTANRLAYLEQVGFFTNDERTAVGAAWGFLSAGSHPGIPSRDEARIALILTLEFGVMLLLKFSNWKANACRAFS
jgi:hypothetical protein